METFKLNTVLRAGIAAAVAVVCLIGMVAGTFFFQKDLPVETTSEAPLPEDEAFGQVLENIAQVVRRQEEIDK